MLGTIGGVLITVALVFALSQYGELFKAMPMFLITDEKRDSGIPSPSSSTERRWHSCSKATRISPKEVPMNITMLLSIVVVGQFGNPLVIPVGDQVPKLNVETSCKTVVDVDLTPQQSYDHCMNDEKEAQKQLTSAWSS